jgi:hypothetical protein
VATRYLYGLVEEAPGVLDLTLSAQHVAELCRPVLAGSVIAPAMTCDSVAGARLFGGGLRRVY